MRLVAQAVGRGEDLLADGFGDVLVAVQGTRHGGDGNPRLTCDILDGDRGSRHSPPLRGDDSLEWRGL
jgi:hypothetical protein